MNTESLNNMIEFPSDPSQRMRLSHMLREICDCRTRIDAEKDKEKEIKARIKDEFGIPPNHIGKIVKGARDKNSALREVHLQDEAIGIAEILENIRNNSEE